MARSPDCGGAQRGHWPALPPEPWKNGGGVTRTLAAEAGARWRISVADIAQGGPYSRFAGDDRVSVVLSGQGATLCGEGMPVQLRPGKPAAFAGDVAWQCQLAAGPVQVLNLFVRRGMARARVRCVGAAEDAGPTDLAAGVLTPQDSAAQRLRFCLALAAGRWQGPDGAQDLAAGEFLLRPAPCTGDPDGEGDHMFTPARGAPPQADGLAAVLLDIFY